MKQRQKFLRVNRMFAIIAVKYLYRDIFVQDSSPSHTGFFSDQLHISDIITPGTPRTRGEYVETIEFHSLCLRKDHDRAASFHLEVDDFITNARIMSLIEFCPSVRSVNFSKAPFRPPRPLWKPPMPDIEWTPFIRPLELENVIEIPNDRLTHLTSLSVSVAGVDWASLPLAPIVLPVLQDFNLTGDIAPFPVFDTIARTWGFPVLRSLGLCITDDSSLEFLRQLGTQLITLHITVNQTWDMRFPISELCPNLVNLGISHPSPVANRPYVPLRLLLRDLPIVSLCFISPTRLERFEYEIFDILRDIRDSCVRLINVSFGARFKSRKAGITFGCNFMNHYGEGQSWLSEPFALRFVNLDGRVLDADEMTDTAAGQESFAKFLRGLYMPEPI
ncbi:hypothetical protein SISNIDRAFT_456909 [Sistotremastrum niveocremeum HHB9708]|uniref:Uncharacterized protein n=1 Tax=Sistotremastrum niveocremeum HHB9708 TaxID=1314777 RepID=A0A164SAJ1_9AGAM|nr:hypothetical protein SISNIDRAFT_456909 [Sistotremastrum niveocremeum HHB9708]